MASFSLLVGMILLIGIRNVAFSAAQRVLLSSNNTTPCYNSTVDLICYHPDLMERGNGQSRYLVTTPSWRVNGECIFHDMDVFNQRPINQTCSVLRVRIDRANFTGDPASFTCYLQLTSGGEDNASTMVDPQDTAAPPILTDPEVIGTNVTVSWDHTNKGPCFNLTFSYNITLYPVVGGVPQRGEGQSVLTGLGATVYIITNLMNDTDYQVELFGFTPSHPPVFSSVATVNFTTGVPPTDVSPTGGGSGDSTATIVGSVTAVVVVMITIIVAIAIAVYCYQKVCKKKSTASPSRGINKKQKKSRKEAANVSVHVSSGEVTLPTEETGR